MSAAPPRSTRQRSAIIGALRAADGFRSAQQLHDDLRHADAGVGLTTVYRALQSLAESGEVDVLRSGDGEALYRRCESGDHHHHLVCRRCRTSVEVDGPAVERWASKVAAAHGFSDVSHTVEVFGLCAACTSLTSSL